MQNKINKKIINREELTQEEAETFLEITCSNIRNYYGLNDPMDPNCKLCFETTTHFGRYMLFNLGYDLEILDIKKILQIPLTHYANLISLNVNGIEKVFLVDMTYSQFFDNTITLDGDGKKIGKKISTQKTFGKISDKEYVKKLRQKGYIELTGDILIEYIDCFLSICNKKNKIEAYKNVEELLQKNNFKIKVK